MLFFVWGYCCVNGGNTLCQLKPSSSSSSSSTWFHPTDEELITHYLSKKVSDGNFNARVIGEVDLNKCEPWDLPC
ncbi:hypothetical protein Sjap_023964 [Stephania japonica]|uniref:NAC domain-containing protein n=1 Tax=Stephania japonica TaxID=461633 RepID=A0AAP0EFS5_9MAGN